MCDILYKAEQVKCYIRLVVWCDIMWLPPCIIYAGSSLSTDFCCIDPLYSSKDNLGSNCIFSCLSKWRLRFFFPSIPILRAAWNVIRTTSAVRRECLLRVGFRLSFCNVTVPLQPPAVCPYHFPGDRVVLEERMCQLHRHSLPVVRTLVFRNSEQHCCSVSGCR